jgi:peptidoglycan L-alanyl-D-glutamate endopeptidase CwlK
MPFKFSARSIKKLEGVHPDLVRVISTAITLTPIDFSVVEGLRTLAKQREYFAKGKSRTMKSRHLTGHAVDLAPWVNGTIDWEDEKGFTAVADAVKHAANKVGVPIEWGYDLWKWDMPHFQLPKGLYP